MALAITVVSDIDEVFNLYETPQQALEIAETTKATGRRLNDRRQYALGLIKGADANAELDALDAAMAEISEAQALCKDLKYEEGRAAMMNAAVKVHMKQQDMEKAYNLARDVVKLFQKLGYRKGEGVGLVTLANVYTARLNADQVIKAGQEALEIFKEIGAQTFLIEAYHVLMDGHLIKEDTFRAAQMVWRAIAVCRQLGNKAKEAMLLLQVANIESQGNDLTKASKAANAAHEIFNTLGQQDGIAKSKGVLIDILLKQDKFYEAVQLAKERIEVLFAANDRAGAGKAFMEMSKMGSDKNDWRMADGYAQAAMGQYMEIRDMDNFNLAQEASNAAKRLRIKSEVSMALKMNADFRHVPKDCIIEPGLPQRVMAEYQQFIKQS